MTELHLARDLALPLDAVTRATAIVGQRGTGKTSTAVVFVEEAAAAGAHFAVIDPTGAWYGLTSNSAGTGAGLECVVMGGHNGDVPLEPESGELVARLVVEERYSVVLDLEMMTKGKQIQFVAQFCEALYHRNRSALTLVVDEAHRYCPQQLRDTERGGYGARCLGAVTDIVTLGRRKGLGAVLISQRPAKINKDVFEESEIVVAHRLMGTNDRKAIAGWLEEKDEDGKAEADAALAKLRKLKQGHALVYAPTMEVFGDFLIRRKRTFDSSATPEIGGEIVLPKKRSEIDLTSLKSRMADTVERAKADDPRELRRQIADLRKQLADRPAVEPERVEVPVLDEKTRDELRAGTAALSKIAAQFDALPAVVADLSGVARTIDARLSNGTGANVESPPRRLPGPRGGGTRPPAPPRRSASPSRPRAETGDLPAAAANLLEALAAFPDGLTREQLALFTGRKPRGGSWNTAIKAILERELADDLGTIIRATHAGLAMYPDATPPTPDVLIMTWRSKLPLAATDVFDVRVDRYPGALTYEELGEATGRAAHGGSWNTAIKALRTSGLVDADGRQALRAADSLMAGSVAA